jgi:hypothetical protein
MVCFCDLPLSLIKKHLKEYGSFGIGPAPSRRKRKGIIFGATPRKCGGKRARSG